VAPGLTVKERLQVLYPGHEKNVHDEFRLCPNEALRQKINQARLLVENWHASSQASKAAKSASSRRSRKQASVFRFRGYG
jgi:type III restriction enzyme